MQSIQLSIMIEGHVYFSQYFRANLVHKQNRIVASNGGTKTYNPIMKNEYLWSKINVIPNNNTAPKNHFIRSTTPYGSSIGYAELKKK